LEEDWPGVFPLIVLGRSPVVVAAATGNAFPAANYDSLHPEPRRKSLRVEGSVDLSVVVEVNENVKLFGPTFGMRNCFGIARLFARAPQLDALSPPVERPVIVTADVKFCRAVLPDVNEIAGQIFSIRKFPGGVGKDKGDIVFAQQIEKVRRHEAFVPNF
jgi:hypothetical protein